MRFRPRAKRPSFASSPSSSHGTRTTRASTGSSAEPTSSWCRAENPLGLDRSDPAAKDDFNSINQLALPVNKPVIIHLSSKDVIHSFSLIQMRVKQDTIPGESIPVWFTPTMIGDWEINCSQLCGLGHYRMRGFYSIKSAGGLRSLVEGNSRMPNWERRSSEIRQNRRTRIR